MSDQPSLPITAGYTPFDPSHRRDEVDKIISDITAAGAAVTGVHFSSPQGPPRFFIQFNADEPQWSVRAKLEAKHYDVGSRLGQNDLTFYVTKRIEDTKGWST
ncbi:MAG: hypothetical protein EPN91_00270 [Salinibacterium sp.]|nr:MAG: hypothetical protein EPN91_00270 [Salinibacterium sp.]